MAYPTHQEILTNRARELARPFVSQRSTLDSSDGIHLLVFHLGPESYAVDVANVLEIVPTERMTPFPSLPSYIVGVLPVRGMIWSVVDLRAFFSIPRKGIADHPRAILVETEKLRFGIITDSTLDIVSCKSLSPPPEIMEKIPRNVGRGIINELTIVLDVEVLAKDPRMIVRDDLE